MNCGLVLTRSKHHRINEAHGIPLAVSLPGGNRDDVTELMPLIQAVTPMEIVYVRSESPARS